MKILSIRIKNLASLAGEHFIDFESQPLASAGLVAIVGKTGAGKSTILDAMCLALFNRVPRLKDSDGKLVDVDGSELLTNSPLTVLRRGTGHGFAELSFVAQDQKVYVARWEIKRARENPNAKLQSVQRSLKCLTDGNVVADKAKAVEAQILRITQLSFEQFTRAVLLAQSEVTAFLKARDNERGELLEYLTNSSIFGKIGQLAYEKTKQIANQRKELENFLGHIELLSEEDLSSITNQFNDYSATYQKLEAEKQKLSHQKQWFDQKQKFEADIQTREQHLNLQQQKVDALAPQKAQLKELETFASIRPDVIQQRSLENELLQLQPKFSQAQQQFNEIEVRFNTEKLAFEKIDAEQQHQQKFEREHQEKIELVRARIADRRVLGEQLNKIKEELKTLETQHHPLLNNEQLLKNDVEQITKNISQLTIQLEETAYFSPLDDALSAHISQLQRFTQSYTQFEDQYGNVNQATQQVSIKEQQLELLIQQHGQDDALNQKVFSLRNQREQLIQKLNVLAITNTQWKNFQDIYIENNKREKECDELKQHIEYIHSQLESAEKEHQNLKKTREQLQHILQQQRLLNTENIEKLRADLVDGEACLVCGSTHHPFTEKEIFSEKLLSLQEQQEQQAIDSEKIAFDTWQQHQKTHAQYSASFEANNKQLLTLKAQLQQAQSQIEQQLSILEINFNFSLDHSVITQAIEASIAESQEAQKQIEENLSVLDQAQKQRFELSQFIQQTKQHLSVVKQAEENIQHIVSLLNLAQQQEWTKNPHHVAQNILVLLQNRQSSLKQLNDLNHVLNSKTQQLDQCSQSVKFSQEKIKTIETRIENLMHEGKNNSDIAIQIIFEMTQMNVEKPHEWLANFEQNRQHLNTQFNDARQNFSQVRQLFETAQASLNQYRTQQTQLQSQINNLKNNIQLWLNQNPEFNEALTQQLSLISHQQELQMKQDVQTIEHLLTEAKSAMKTIQEQLQQHLVHQPEIDLESLISQFGNVEQELKLTIEKRDELKLKLEVHQQNVVKQQQFADQIQKIQTEEHRWNKISSLMGDSTGKKFRDYAQQYNLDILIEYANQQLAMLSQRYTLKRLENSLSLAIVDHDMDGETRSVSSLSGGESFLTALALSLAIASMASGSMKIESLFIDEGFGTLDASSLHMVMNALDQLQSQGRKVVLISHIQEMHERIPVQIQVKPVGAGASTIEVVG
jgi:DNA repair protein SbcC/Rad50